VTHSLGDVPLCTYKPISFVSEDHSAAEVKLECDEWVARWSGFMRANDDDLTDPAVWQGWVETLDGMSDKHTLMLLCAALIQLAQ
jgi:hypothetical protein